MLLRHSAYYLLARGVPGLLNFLAIAIYTRLLSPEDYGRYALVVAGVSLFNVVFFQWIRLSLLRFLPAHEQEPKPLIATVLASFLGVALFTGILGVGLATFWPSHLWQPLILLGILLLWAMAWFELNLELNRIQLKPQRYGLLSMLKAGTALALGAGFVLWGLGAYGPLLGLLLAMVIAGILGAADAIWLVRPRVDSAKFNTMLAYGLPLTATFALAFIVSASDRFLLAGFLGESEAGLYSAAYDLASQSLTLLMMVVNLAAYPLAVRALEAKGWQAAKTQLRQNALLLLAIALPASIGVVLLAPNIAAVLFGVEFRDTAERLLPWVALAVLLAGLRAYYFDLAFQLGRWTRGQVWVMAIAAFSNVLFNLWWIPLYGMLGAAWATVMAYAIAMALSVTLGKRVFSIPFPWFESFRLLLAVAGMAGALFFVSEFRGMIALVSQILMAVICYGALLLMLNVGECRNHIRALVGSDPVQYK